MTEPNITCRLCGVWREHRPSLSWCDQSADGEHQWTAALRLTLAEEAPSTKAVELLALITALHERVGDGYHDGTDHAIDATIDVLHAAGFLPDLPADWEKRLRVP